MPGQDLAVFSIGMIPFLLILGAFIVMGAFFLLGRMTADDITEILLAMGTIWLVVMVVLIFVTQICMAISPREMFADLSGQETPVQEFFAAFAKAESDVCTMTADIVEFIKNDVGKPGQDDPSLNDQAIQKAVSKVDGPITTCPPAPQPTTVDDINDRLTRMEQTLNQLIEPELKHTYEVTFDTKDCFVDFLGAKELKWRRRRRVIEGFEDPQDEFIKMVDRLQGIQGTIASLTAQYLAPIQQKQKDLKSGKPSDCDKKKGAKSSVSSSLNQIKGSSKPGM
jgi:hypothetical protein